MDNSMTEFPIHYYKDRLSPVDSPYRRLSEIIFAQDKIEVGDLPRYVRDPVARCFVIPKRGAVPSTVCEAEEFIIPLVEIASLPVFKMNELSIYGDELIDSTVKRSIDSVYREEDTQCLRVLDAVVPSDQILQVPKALFEADPKVMLLYFCKCIAMLRSHELLTAYIITSPIISELLTMVEHKHLYMFKDRADTQIYARGTTVAGVFKQIPILVHSSVPSNATYIIASPYLAGLVVRQQDVIASDLAIDVRKLTKECLVRAEVGFGCSNDYACTKIVLQDDDVVKDDVVANIQPCEPLCSPKPAPALTKKIGFLSRLLARF